jgi:diguanylate cyclase (GGDEF)-like protein
MAAVLETGAPEETVPSGMAKQTWLVVLSPDRKLVVSRSANAPARLGSPTEGTIFATPMRGRNVVRTDKQGRSWLLQEVSHDGDGWQFVAGLPKRVALAPAQAQLQRSLLIGGVILALILAVAAVVHRGLARPIRRLRKAIDAGNDERAPDAGPAEVMEVATAYNRQVEFREALEADLRYQASHDALTGLPNRRQLTAVIDEAIASADQPHNVAVLFVDLDRFKLVNDSHGHAVGDMLLVALGQRLSESLAGCIVGRFGGDEFLILTPAISGEVEARGLAGRVAEILEAPFRLAGVELYVTGSVGIAVCSEGESAEDLIRNADTAMYRSKEDGPGRSALFDRPMRTWAQARLDTERRLHRALENDEFELHYQPLFSIASGELVQAEALVRWRSPERGLVQPTEFIPVAEETRLIVPLGEWVIQEAARQMAAWKDVAGRSIPVAVNVAAHQLSSSELPGVLRAALECYGLDPDELAVEITESAVFLDEGTAHRTLEAVRSMGMRVAVDDFGTGYSSLSYLQRLPIDEVKIDRSFISPLGQNETTAAIVGSIIDLAHAVGLEVVAEGVEEAPQLLSLSRMGCDIAQGFYLGRPSPAVDLARLLVPISPADRVL